MEIETDKNFEQKKESLKKILDDMLYRVEHEEELLKELQERFAKQKKEIRKWLSWMG